MMVCQRKSNLLRKFWTVLILLMGCAVLLTGCGSVQAALGGTAFADRMDAIAAEFQYKDYKEVIGADRTHVSALPQNAANIDADADQYYNRQKSFAYRSDDDGTLILLEITASQSKSDEWSHSITYHPALFNADGALYSTSRNDRIPDVQITNEVFTYRGYSYSVLCFAADDSDKSGAIAMDFCNALIQYLKG